MKLYELKKTQMLPIARDQVFTFFERPENLAKLTPPSLGFQILTPSPIEMKAGSLIDYTVRVLGMSLRWTTLITDYDPPHQFVDVQLKGPYSFWHHTHQFEKADGGTQMTDTVRYAMPFGILGRVAHRLFVTRQLQRIFRYRSEVLEAFVGYSSPQ